MVGTWDRGWERRVLGGLGSERYFRRKWALAFKVLAVSHQAFECFSFVAETSRATRERGWGGVSMKEAGCMTGVWEAVTLLCIYLPLWWCCFNFTFFFF